ncbi:hypothetical protein OROMI_009892 [Orobanche minor]
MDIFENGLTYQKELYERDWVLARFFDNLVVQSRLQTSL